MKAGNVLDTAYQTIKKYNMLVHGDRVIIGVSGGPDSLCLLHLLNYLKHGLCIELFAVHVHHGLRGENADKDEGFVREFVQKLGIPILVKHANIKDYAKKNKMSLEEAGRQVRYSYFNEVLSKVHANKIAVGHNMNDSVETLLINLIRGSGIEGLKGIEPVRGNIIRPLIKISRCEIEKYCTENNLNPRIDESNAERIFTRNKIRLELIPYLEERFNPNIINALNRTAQLIYDENLFLNDISMDYYSKCLIEFEKDKIKLSRELFNSLQDSIKRRVIRHAIEKIKGDIRTVEKVHIDQAMDVLLNGKTGAWVKIPKDIIIKVQYNQIIIMLDIIKSEINYSYIIPIPGELEIPEVKSRLSIRKLNITEIETIKRSNYICLLDYNELNEDLPDLRHFTIRNRRNGDKIILSGIKGSKKLKDYFIDEKIPQDQRTKIPLVAIGNEIIWIIGRRHSERYKVTTKTKEVLVLEYENRE